VENFVENVNKSEKALGKPVLRGHQKSTLDEKGRMNVPSKFREALGEGFVIARHIDSKICCLKIYTESAWGQFNDRLKEIPQEEMSIVKRSIDSQDVEVKSGRFLVPISLRKHANLNGEAVFIGMEDTAELWSKEEFDKCNTDTIADAAAILKKYGI